MSDKWIPNPRPFPERPPFDWPAGSPPRPTTPDAESEPESEPRPPGHRGNLAMILGVIGVALVAALVTYLVLRVVRPPKPRVNASVPTMPATSTTSTTLPSGPAITSAELARLVSELVPFVERSRQLTFTTAPTVILESEASYATSLRTYLAGSRGMLQRLSDPFEVLGMNPSDADLDRAVEAFWGSKTVVFYDTVHNIVHVRAVPATPYLSTMLVVGLTEELDDQHFTTDRIATPSAYGDSDFGMMTLVGGDAWRIASLWASSRPDDEQRRIKDELQARRGQDADSSKVPSALASWLRYPADSGVNFTLDLVTSASSAPLDSVFRNPPDGSAQVLAPGRIAAGIDQLPVAVPGVDGKVTSSGTFGRMFIEAFLSPVVPDDVLSLALDGYRGDTLVAYQKKGSGSCIRLDVTTGDSAPDNMRRALGSWAAQRSGTVSLVADSLRPGHKVVRLDACSGGGSSSDTTTTTTGGAAGDDTSSTVPGGPRP